MKRMIWRSVAVIILLLLLLATFVYARSSLALRQTWQIDEPALSIPDDPAAIARGHTIAITRGCLDCHGENLAGNIEMDVPAVGRLAGPNLTRGKGGVVADFTVEDWEHAIRHGIGPNGRGLLFMPAVDFAGLTDADTADLIAYLRQSPPVDKVMPKTFIGPIGRALFAFGKLPLIDARRIDQRAPHVGALMPAASVDYGRYLAQGCVTCHGTHFSGGAIPGMPPDTPKSANLTRDPATGLGRWTREDFFRALRQGVKPDGRPIAAIMPWRGIGKFSDTDLDALWLYFRSLPPRAAGGR